MKDYQSFYRYSIENPEAFWREQADLIGPCLKINSFS